MWALLAWLAAAAAAEAFFPIGLYGVDEPRHLAALRKDGFNAVHTARREPPVLRDLGREARRQGMRLLVQPNGFLETGGSDPGLPLAAWYLADEPDVARIAPEELERLDREVRRWSRGGPTALVVGDGRAAARYAGSAGILMVDWYPVPHLPLVSAGEHVRRAVEAARGKPVWAVLQAFDWRDSPQRDPKKPRIGRFPDHREIRFMTYDAIIEGARGVWYFTYRRPDGSVLGDSPELWQAVRRVARELDAMRRVFAEGERLGGPEGLTRGLKGAVFAWRGRRYYVIANATGGPVFLPTYYYDRRFRPVFEPRRGVAGNLRRSGSGAWMPPWRVLILEAAL